MLLKYFSSNKAGLLIVILCIALLLWMSTLVNSPGINPVDLCLAGPLGRLMLKPLSALPGLSSLLAVIVILFCGYLLIQLNTKYSFLKSKSQLPQLFLIVITGSLASTRFLSPSLLFMLFVIIILYRTFESFKKDRLTFHFLDGGILMGFAVMVYIPALIIFPLLFIVLLLFRNKIWQEWLYPGIGFCLPFLFWASYLFMTDQSLQNIGEEFRRTFSASGRAQAFTLVQLIIYGYLALLALIGSFHMILTIGTRKIQSRVFFMVFFWLFALSILMVWVIPAAGTDFLFIGGISITFLLSNYFATCRNTRFNNLLLALLLVGIILVVTDDWLSFVPGRFTF
jgi:hypothetical protein